MIYRILKAPNGRWGEGHKVGDLVAFDYESAKVALENGEIEEAKPIEENVEIPELVVALECPNCKKVCKSKLGLGAHVRSCK